jgi:hypothetical protein
MPPNLLNIFEIERQTLEDKITGVTAQSRRSCENMTRAAPAATKPEMAVRPEKRCEFVCCHIVILFLSNRETTSRVEGRQRPSAPCPGEITRDRTRAR